MGTPAIAQIKIEEEAAAEKGVGRKEGRKRDYDDDDMCLGNLPSMHAWGLRTNVMHLFSHN